MVVVLMMTMLVAILVIAVMVSAAVGMPTPVEAVEEYRGKESAGGGEQLGSIAGHCLIGDPFLIRRPLMRIEDTHQWSEQQVPG